jgi:hypothetical protein
MPIDQRTMQQIGSYNPNSQPQPQQSGVRASWVGDKLKQAGKWVEEKITQPFVQGIKDPVGAFKKNTSGAIDNTKEFLDENIGKPITDAVVKPIKRGLGLEETPIPDEVKPKTDPSKIEAMAQYGTMIQNQAGQFNPAAYGPNYFQTRQFTPTITTGTQNMPGIYSPQRQAPTVPQAVATPQLQNVSGPEIQLRDVSTGTGLNTLPMQGAVMREMAKYQDPMALESGYGQGFVENYVGKATSGLEQQKQRAMETLKENQMKAGNFGSSVGQRQMTELAADYDRQMTEAQMQAELLAAEANREDRYRNVSADLSRSGMLGNLAGQGAGMELQSQSYKRDTVNMQNDAELIKQNFARQGIQIDNDTALQMAQFGSGQQQQQFGNQMSAADFNRAGELASYESDWRRYLAGQDVAQNQDAVINQAQMFNIGQGDTAEVRNYGMYQDMLRNLAGYGSNSITPESEINYNLWLAQQAQKNQAMQNSAGVISKFIPVS